MNSLNSTISTHQKDQHLALQDRVIIQVLRQHVLSISERPAAINQRREFGHWECDLVLGHKTKDDQALLTLYERMTRKFMIIPIKDKTAACVMPNTANLKESLASVLFRRKDDILIFASSGLSSQNLILFWLK